VGAPPNGADLAAANAARAGLTWTATPCVLDDECASGRCAAGRCVPSAGDGIFLDGTTITGALAEPERPRPAGEGGGSGAAAGDAPGRVIQRLEPEDTAAPVVIRELPATGHKPGWRWMRGRRTAR
jgi:hypothetical protein